MKLLVKAKLGNKLKSNKIKIGILGGTFDPAHKGHLEISKQAKKIFDLKNIIWAITKKNPFKKKSKSNLKKRIKFAKKLIGINSSIKVKFYEDKIASNKTIDLINHIKKDKKLEINFIMGADNLINFHKWHKWRSISQKCTILVFDRQGYKAKSLKSITFKRLSDKRLTFIKFKKVNISSSKLRKI
ncbi:MAG: nicotinate-nucleotide adenylyltransferase [Pelagibacterales bacterium]|nr:nicotinate-nucleotide adenylyltransferase [Pelagibacterales bacterium]